MENQPLIRPIKNNQQTTSVSPAHRRAVRIIGMVIASAIIIALVVVGIEYLHTKRAAEKEAALRAQYDASQAAQAQALMSDLSSRAQPLTDAQKKAIIQQISSKSTPPDPAETQAIIAQQQSLYDASYQQWKSDQEASASRQ